MKKKDALNYLSKEWQRIIIETDEKEPIVIAEITQNDINVSENYRLRLKPTYD